MSRILLITAAALALLAGVGCRPPAESPRVTGPASRVISLSPNMTEILFAVGAGQQVVGVTDFCTYPAGELTDMTRIGAYLNPDVERMFALQPDLVVLLPSQAGLRERLEAAHIPTLTVANESLDEVLDSIDALGKATGHDEEARQLRAELEADLDRVRQAAAGSEPTPTLVVIGRGSGDMAGIFGVGPGTFLDEVIRVAGGRNVLAKAVSLYPQVPLEEVIRLAPQVIIEVVVPPSALEPDQVIAAWNDLDSIPAVQDGRVHVLTEDHLLIPGPRAVRTAQQLHPLLHPEPREEGSP